jgi:pimeloyl-ACP methyl ester carboxylesterase
MPFLKRITLFLSFFVVLLIALDSCSLVQFRYKDATIIEDYHKKGLNPQLKRYKIGERTVRYLEMGSDDKPSVLLIHGAPSSLSIFNPIIQDSLLWSKAKVFAVDRPGYGYSDFGKTEVSIANQAALLKPILDSMVARHRPIILFGESYGGPIACKLAMDYPDLIDGVVLAAPSLEPGQETYFSISYPMRWWGVKYIFPRLLRIATDEKWAHKTELEKLLPQWKNLRAPVIYLQGMNDEIVNPSNAEFARKQLVNSKKLDITMIPNQKHFMAWPQKELIVRSIGQLLEQKLP